MGKGMELAERYILRPRTVHSMDVEVFSAHSHYVETYWLPLLGPSSTFMLRRFATWLRHAPEVNVVMADLAAEIGLSPSLGRNNALARTVRRLEDFGMVMVGDGVLLAHTHLPRLSDKQRTRLPAHLATTLEVSCLLQSSTPARSDAT